MISLIILGLIAGWREVQILCEMQGRWFYVDFRNWFWFTNQAGKWKNFDSFHFSHGLYALCLVISLVTCTKCDFICAYLNQFLGTWSILAYVLITWFIYMYARNIMMHVILPKKPDFRYLVGTWFKRKVSK